jgi:hypothetical protein
VKVTLKKGKDRKDRLPISVIKEGNPPQHSNDIPFVAVIHPSLSGCDLFRDEI